MKRLALILLLASVVCFPVMASAPKDELTFAVSLFNPNDGETVWSGTGEYLIGIGGTFLLGPSVLLFDLGEVDGGAFGVAGEVGIGKTSGLFVGGAVRKFTGDAADVADFSGEARAGVKFGGERGFVKVYASQVWSRAEDGAITDPDGTSFQAGLGLRF